MRKKAIIYVPGLNDHAFLNKKLIQLLPVIWKPHGYEIYPVYPHWNTGHFTPKLHRIIQKIDELSAKQYDIYLIGQSAGATAVLNAFVERKQKIKKVVNICGRLREAKGILPSLDKTAKNSPAHKEAVLLFDKENEKKLTKQDRKKILTMRPLFDEIVPKSTVGLSGATNIVIPIVEHSLGGITALTIFSQRIRDFIE